MSQFLPPMYEHDSRVVGVTVSDGAGPLSLSGATVVAQAQANTGATLTLTAAVTDTAAGQFTISIPAGVIAAGVYAVQARVTLPNGEAQTVIDARQTVLPSVL